MSICFYVKHIILVMKKSVVASLPTINGSKPILLEQRGFSRLPAVSPLMLYALRNHKCIALSAKNVHLIGYK